MGTVVHERNELFAMWVRTSMKRNILIVMKICIDSFDSICAVMGAAGERSPKQAPCGGRPLCLPRLVCFVMKVHANSFKPVKIVMWVRTLMRRYPAKAAAHLKFLRGAERHTARCFLSARCKGISLDRGGRILYNMSRW